VAARGLTYLLFLMHRLFYTFIIYLFCRILKHWSEVFYERFTNSQRQYDGQENKIFVKNEILDIFP